MANQSRTSPILDSTFDVDKLACEIFSILENKFLFGDESPTKAGKVRILSIDGGGSTDGILAAKSLSLLESSLRKQTTDPHACISDFFDVVSGTGAGGILAALLFTRGPDNRPLCTADEALQFLLKNRKFISRSPDGGIFRRVFRLKKGVRVVVKKMFGELTLKDTLKPVLIPCYDLATCAPFVFSRADALEMDGYDFKLEDVCVATSADPGAPGAVEMTSVDKRNKITAIGGSVAMNNPTAVAITHVLNNKQEFPFCQGVEDILVMSLGNGESDFRGGNATSSPAKFVRIAGEGTSDMVDQSVSMAFGDCRGTNYVRIQANGLIAKKRGGGGELKRSGGKLSKDEGMLMDVVEEMLKQKNVESILFKGKELVQKTNAEKLEMFADKLVKEEERRKTEILPTVLLKQSSASPRTSSATTLSLSSN